MASLLPLFDQSELVALRLEREELLLKLRKGSMDIRSRIRTEQKAALVTAKLMKLEIEINRGAR